MRERGHVCMEESHSHFFKITVVFGKNVRKANNKENTISQVLVVKININHNNWLKVYQSIIEHYFQCY